MRQHVLGIALCMQARTENRQNPWDASSMTGDFYFTPPAAAPPALSVREEIRHERGVLAFISPVEASRSSSTW